MDRTFAPTIYIRLRKRTSVAPGEVVTLGHVAELLTEPAIERALRDLPLCKPSERDGNIVLIDMMHIVKTIHSVHPQLKVEHFGEPHTIIDVLARKRRPNRFALVAVWLLLFIGSGLAIMNFHEDVSMMEVHQRIYEMITGTFSEHPYWLQIPYSLGLGAGMVLFFNQLFQKKFSEEPSPLEVEMFTYQESLNHYVITEEYKKLARTHRLADRDDSEDGKGGRSGSAPT
ncbi:MAG: stage sporulation protein [Paenibacillus sp.]|jgi:stage V sporulation protein AA|nr:stage sporulation protein [Paenibacillus sp.]